MVSPCSGGWALRAGIGMTINLPCHPMSVTQCYLGMNDILYITHMHVIRVVYSFHPFQMIDYDAYVYIEPIVYYCLCAVILVS